MYKSASVKQYLFRSAEKLCGTVVDGSKLGSFQSSGVEGLRRRPQDVLGSLTYLGIDRVPW
jgi:hypothetical protein